MFATSNISENAELVRDVVPLGFVASAQQKVTAACLVTIFHVLHLNSAPKYVSGVKWPEY